MSRKLYIKTLGCQMNVYDSRRVADLLATSHGFTLTQDPQAADLLLLNTCSIREKAQEKVFSELGRWRPLKQARPGVMIGVGGCVASQEGEAIVARAPFVDVVFGPQTLHRVPQLLDRVAASKRAAIDIAFPEIEKFDRLPEPSASGPCAFVSIMEGCSKYCTFCVVPYTRGEEFSRPFDDVIAEVAGLADRGVREVTLLGQNVNAYRGPMHGGGTGDLALLIRYMAEIDGIERIRFTTSHPLDFDEHLVAAFAEVPKLAAHLHLPVQSGSDRILALMKRGHSIADYKEMVRQLRAARPDVSLTSDFIVGFPGETADDFIATLALVDDVEFDGAYSFLYSARPGTPAAALTDATPADVKQQRLLHLQDKLAACATRARERLVGTRQRILVESQARRDASQLSGRTSSNHAVNFAAADKRLIGRMIDVEITAVLANSLGGRLVESLASAVA
ncbi:MAG TPA: tRNA (N6-isopentenyl adenosine(37)-C2)-methylthiotransferase MiaB [Burkholderiales bacterium]|nr:tRNA (N6-isopentenyl adenosine(37)-C2)-methylthiotransferase MiaB [Burkholderiales bacterium]